MKDLALELIVYFLTCFAILVGVINFTTPAHGQVFIDKEPMDYGCFTSYETGKCQEPEYFYWKNYGRLANEYAYGSPVGQLLTTAVRWIRYAKELEADNRRLRARIKKAKHGTTN